jgi:hypothetical protein
MLTAAWAAVLLVALLVAVSACGTSGAKPAGSSTSGGVHAYATCLFQHLDRNSGAGARRACQSLRPADGLAPVLQAFASCLQSHGVVLPSQSPGTSAGDVLHYLGQLASGTPAQRAAFGTCESSV